MRILLVFLLMTLTGYADDFSRGNAAYVDGKFDVAIEAYEAAVASGTSNANLFYNLGNAYYRAGRVGKAALNYERALVLNPGHAEAIANLRVIREDTSKRTLPRELLVIIASGAAWFAVLTGGLALLLRRRTPWTWAAMAALIVVATAGVGAFLQPDPTKTAIVVAADTAAYFAPVRDGKQVARLPEGAAVRVLDRSGDWMYAALRDGGRGYIRQDAVEDIIK